MKSKLAHFNHKVKIYTHSEILTQGPIKSYFSVHLGPRAMVIVISKDTNQFWYFEDIWKLKNILYINVKHAAWIEYVTLKTIK